MDISDKHIIAYTSGLFSLISIEDSNHSKALQFQRVLDKEDILLIVIQDVFVELINVIGKRISHKIASEVANTLLEGDKIIVSNYKLNLIDIHTQALKLFLAQSESVSYTDCLVMIAAKSYNTKTIFGFDKVFKKNGYITP